MKVTDDIVVSLEYVLSLDSGEVIDRSDPGEPLEYLHGRGQIINGLENALYGLAVGDEKHVTVEPADGYGDHDEENIVVIPMDDVPDDMNLKIGDRLYLRDDNEKEDIEAYVDEVNAESVRLNLNHPLAGERLHFDIRIAGLRPATAGELAHGHVHEPGHAH